VREGRVKYKGKIKFEREKRNNFISKCTKGKRVFFIIGHMDIWSLVS
jgi:hypothetical protein